MIINILPLVNICLRRDNPRWFCWSLARDILYRWRPLSVVDRPAVSLGRLWCLTMVLGEREAENKEIYSDFIFGRLWMPTWDISTCDLRLLTYNCDLWLAPGTKHPMPFFDTPDKTSRINLLTRTKHPMQFLSPRTKHPMPFLPPRTKHPMPFLPPRTKQSTLCLKPMKVHKHPI